MRTNIITTAYLAILTFGVIPFTGCAPEPALVVNVTTDDGSSAPPHAEEATGTGGSTDDDTGDTSDTGTVTSTNWYADLDGDGQGSDASVITGEEPTDSSINWVDEGGDCDDSDPLTFVGAAEFESATLCEQDDDQDGYGAKSPDVSGVTIGTDCNDTSSSIHPGAADVASDGIDANCDGTDTAASATYTYYQDADGDGYGNAASSTTSTTQPSGYVTNSTDCLDTDTTVHPGATEVTGNGKDDDCNTSTSDTASSSSTSHTICVTGVDANVGTNEIFLMGNSFVDATYWPAGDWSSLSTASTNQFVTISGTVQSCNTWSNAALTRGATFKQNGYGVYSGANRWAVQAASSPVTISSLTFDGTALTPSLSGNDEVYTVP